MFYLISKVILRLQLKVSNSHFFKDLDPASIGNVAAVRNFTLCVSKQFVVINYIMDTIGTPLVLFLANVHNCIIV